jgi:glycosyltransferase involved in cell wall biosynthesis
MNILYDTEIFCQKYGGISRYFAMLIRYLPEYDNIRVLFPLLYSTNEYLDHRGSLWLPNKEFPGKGRIARFVRSLENKRVRKYMNNLGVIYHPTYYLNTVDHLKRSQKMIVTIHDMIHELFPEEVMDSNASMVIKRKLKLMERAHRIIAVSQVTKNAITEVYPFIPEDKIEVIYHGFENKESGKNDPNLHGLDCNQPYFLFVGNRNGYKNFNILLDVWVNIDDAVLVCCGGGPVTKCEKQKINTNRLENKIKFINPSDRELVNLYSNAMGLILTSKYEGFGMPVIEAFNYGCSVIAFDNSIFHEIGGELISYFESKEELISLIAEKNNNQNSADISEKLKSHTKKFSIKKMLDAHFELYKAVDLQE